MGNVQNLIAIPKKLDPILWVGNASPISLPKFFSFQGREVDIFVRATLSEALTLLKNEKFSVIIVQSVSSMEELDFLTQARLYQTMAPRLLLAEHLHEQDVREAINKAQIFRILRWPAQEQEVWQILEAALERHSNLLSRSLLMRESSHQNKQLEALTNSLEEMVEVRTQHIQMSHREEEEKLSRERQLIRFIKDLASQNSFEEILGILRKELRKFHKMGDPILAYRLGGGKTFFMSFHLGHFNQTESSKYFDFPKSAGMPVAAFSRIFANHFGRPFVKAYIVPLELRLTSRFLGRDAEAILCVENSLTEKELTPFLDFIGDRMRPLSMALDRVLLENQLSIFSYRWEKTFDGMRDPIAILDTDFNVVRSNRKFSERFIQQKCYEVFAQRQSPCEGCPAQQALREGQTQIGQIRVGGRVYQVHSYPILLDHGVKATNVVHQYVDITQSRELYLRMLQNEKMGAIGMLAGHIAHELNNPLTGLRSLAQVLLQEAPKNENLYTDLVEIEKATARSQKIIKNLLDFSKGENQPLEFVNVDDVIERTLPMLKSALRNHRLEVDLNSGTDKVWVEPHLLQQVVFNLINNACQAMKDAGTLTIRTNVNAEQVVIEVEDTGPGVSEELQRRIFEPFFTTKKEGHGTGLGLSMSKSIIEKFGGIIRFSNVKPHGSCFSIVLPLNVRSKI